MEDSLCAVEFSPAGKAFEFKLSPYDCFRVATGVCSLDLSEEEASRYPPAGEGGVSHCRDLYNDFLKRGVLDPVWIHYNSCNHYSISGGQRRICITARKRLTLPTHIGNNGDSVCRHCGVKKDGYTWIHMRKYPLLSRLLRLFKLPRSRYRPDTFIVKF